MKELIILGAGGHAKEVFWLTQRYGQYRVVAFLDETISEEKNLSFFSFPIVSSLDKFISLKKNERPAVISAVGDNKLRKRWHDQYYKEFEFISLVDPDSIIGFNIAIGFGSIVFPSSVLTFNVVIGNHVNIHSTSIITHDAIIGDFCFIGPGCKLLGGVQIGKGSFLGAGAVVLPRKKVGDWSIIGAGAVVASDIPSNCTAVGIPARVIKQEL